MTSAWKFSILDGNNVHFSNHMGHIGEYESEDEAIAAAMPLVPEVFKPKAIVLRKELDNSSLSFWSDLWATDVQYVVRDIIRDEFGNVSYASARRFGLIDKWKFWTHVGITILALGTFLALVFLGFMLMGINPR